MHLMEILELLNHKFENLLILCVRGKMPMLSLNPGSFDLQLNITPIIALAIFLFS